LSVVAAGVGDHAAGAVFFRQGGDLVVGATEFEGSDWLLIFGLEKKAGVLRANLGKTEFD
jgi:hypothetical protein